MASNHTSVSQSEDFYDYDQNMCLDPEYDLGSNADAMSSMEPNEVGVSSTPYLDAMRATDPSSSATSHGGPYNPSWALKGLDRGLGESGKNFDVRFTPKDQLGRNTTRLNAIDKTRGKPGKDGQPKGKSIFRVDGPHGGALHPHVNIENMPPKVKGLETFNHSKIPDIPDHALRGLKGARKVLGPLSFALDGYDLYSSYQKDKSDGDGQYDDTTRAVGRVGGGWAGAAGGAALGASIGSVIPGLGTAVGGLVGGVIGGIAGGWGGSVVGEKIADQL